MKKFIISVLCVAIFFIGLGGLVEKTSASFRSDARALELIRLARVAVGGDANIDNVRSMTIKGNSAHVMNINGVSETKQGSLEINFELPGKFSKMIRFGEPGEGEMRKNVEVVIVRKDGDAADPKDSGDGKKIFVVKNGDGKVLTEDVKGADDQRRIIIKKADGTTEELDSGDKKNFTFERKDGGEPIVVTSGDGTRIFVNKDVKIARDGDATRHTEMLRTTLALLLTAPEGTDAGYAYAGETTIDGATVNIVEVSSGDSSFKLFLDKTTNLPKMLSYLGAPLNVVKFDKPVSPDGAPQRDVKVFVKKTESSEMVEHQVKFSDFRTVGGLLLPHKWTESVGGSNCETIDITNYEINPANIADKFQNQKVFVRTEKP